MSRSHLTAGGALLLAVVLYISAATQEAEAAYQFPRLLAICMIIIALGMLIAAWRRMPEGGHTAATNISWDKLWPAFAVLVIYLGIMEFVGFYISSLVVFFVLSTLYGPRLDLAPARLTRLVGTALAFMGVLYVIFAVFLRVQTPRGLLF